MYNSPVTFTSGGPFRQKVFTQVINDKIALEDDEIVTLELTIDSPSSGVNFSYFPATVVRVVDDDCKHSIVLPLIGRYPVCVCFDMFCSACICVAVLVQFVQPEVQVNENEMEAEICVQKNLQTIGDLKLDLVARSGTATGKYIHLLHIL